MRPIPVIDGHNDLAWAYRQAEGAGIDTPEISLPQPELRTDLIRLRQGSVAGQFWSVYVPASLPGPEAVVATLEQVALVHRLVERQRDSLELCSSAAEVEAAMASGRIASLLGAEGGHSIGGSLAVLQILYRLGVRYLTLTHSRNVGWADSATDEPGSGLTEFGVAVVRELNRLGMLVDLSHVAAGTAQSALRESRAPVIFSHSSCRQLCDHPRNVADDLLVQLGEVGGVVMITFVPSFVSEACRDWQGRLQEELAARQLEQDSPEADRFGEEWRQDHPAPRATVSQVADHVEHAREVAGIDHLGLGGDFDGTSDYPEGLEDVAGYPRLMQELADRSWSEAELRQLGAGNILAVLRAAEVAAAGAGQPEAGRAGSLSPGPAGHLANRLAAPGRERGGG